MLRDWRIAMNDKTLVERLREALRFYADDHKNPNDGPWGISSDDFGAVAHAALQPQEKVG